MAEPTLAGIFGNSATQTATQLVISKTDLATVGLTASATNTPESLLAAIIALAQLTLSQSNYEINLDQSVIINDSIDSLTTRNNTTYRQKTKIIEFFKLDTSNNFDPDDY
ncbi:hypothetical protein NIES4075_44510 [Tolypothrix sp. NIES-4075]|uniref:hypothetical protein n=1 Tax=Tolypothrix sp. NIES-4075 TaxID=2005459 RepID=UPI000B5CE643|nr:hypothetical protein [Tolypothrix sp. NIES-4075]GAX43438.1 hypothetical protein NIES4075_44510 [Tolypothrix sp. NIES-4075]